MNAALGPLRGNAGNEDDSRNRRARSDGFARGCRAFRLASANVGDYEDADEMRATGAARMTHTQPTLVLNVRAGVVAGKDHSFLMVLHGQFPFRCVD
jgi:hypothetical protein